MTQPYGGYTGWTYRTTTFSGSRSIREMASRSVSYSGAPVNSTVIMGRDPADLSRTAHYWAELSESAGKGDKVWIFESDPAQASLGLVKVYQERDLSNGKTLLQVGTGWRADPAGNQYIWAATTTQDVGTADATTKQVTQSVDAYGNMFEQYYWDWGSSAINRTYRFSYLTDANYTNRYIRNRLTSSTVTDGTKTVTLVSNTYDEVDYGPDDVPGIKLDIEGRRSGCCRRVTLGPKFTKRDRRAAMLERSYYVHQVEHCQNFIFKRNRPGQGRGHQTGLEGYCRPEPLQAQSASTVSPGTMMRVLGSKP